MVRNDSQLAAPTCPRCDYDLSGEVATWKVACPLVGICPECGLKLDWRSVLVPVRRRISDHFEAAITRRPRALLRSVLACYRPRRLWAWLSLDVPLDPVRAVSIGTVALLLGWAFVPLAAIGIWWVTIRQQPLPIIPLIYHRVGFLAWPFGGLTPGAFRTSSFLVLVVLWAGFVPIALLVLTQTLRRAKATRRHILRISIYSIGVIPIAGTTAVLATEGLVALGSTGPVDIRTIPAIRDLFVVAVSGLWLLWYWHAAVRWYLRIERPLAVALAIVAMAAMASFIVVMAIPSLRASLGLFW